MGLVMSPGLTSAYAQGPATDDLGLVGDRFRPLTASELTPGQQAMVDSILAGPRNGLGGPFNTMLRSPEMGDLAQKLGAYARFDSVLPANLRELAIIMTARFWAAEFEWYAHKRAALAAGVDPGAVDAIAAGRVPETLQADEVVVYRFLDELLETRRVSDAAFAEAVDLLGERGVVDLVGTSGYYGIVAMLLNVDRYPLPEGVEPELAPE
jgi:4-carboxymuconolactone decarboxylase